MGKRLLSLLMILTMILTLFSGCFGKAKADKAFAAPILDEPTSLDPQIADSDSEKTIVLNCFEGLLRVNAKGELESGVAESYTVSPDKLTYTFKLRDNAHWALFSGHKDILGENYEEAFDINVYAEDFKFAFDRIFDERINSPYRDMFYCVDSYEATDKHTFIVKLKFEDENFLYSLTTPGAMPCDEAFYELTGGKYGLDAKYLLCNGPFNVSKWVENTSVRIVRNDDYNGVNTVKPSSVTFYINSSEAQVAEKMNSNTYDIAYLNKYNYESLEDKEDYNFTGIENTVYSLVFNQSDKYLSNRNIRLALNYACDFSALNFEDENIKRAVSVIPPFCKIGNEPYINDNFKPTLNSFNAENAKKCFEQGLLELGESSVELNIKCTEEYENVIKQLVQSMQKTLGVKFIVSVTAVEQSELAAVMRDGSYSVAFYPYTAQSVFVSDFLDGISKSNILNYNSDKYADLMKNIKENTGSSYKTRELCAEAEKMLISDAVMVPVFYENSYFISSDDTEGIYFYSSGNNIFFINAVKK